MAHVYGIMSPFSGGQGIKGIFANWNILAILFAQCLLFLVPIPCSLWPELFKALDLHFRLLQVMPTSCTHTHTHTIQGNDDIDSEETLFETNKRAVQLI